MAQDLANAIVFASYEMINGNIPRAFATLKIVISVRVNFKVCLVDVPNLDREYWPAASSRNTHTENLATALNRLSYAGFYPTSEQLTRIEQFWSRPITQNENLTLILCRTIPTGAFRPKQR